MDEVVIEETIENVCDNLVEEDTVDVGEMTVLMTRSIEVEVVESQNATTTVV